MAGETPKSKEVDATNTHPLRSTGRAVLDPVTSTQPPARTQAPFPADRRSQKSPFDKPSERIVRDYSTNSFDSTALRSMGMGSKKR